MLIKNGHNLISHILPNNDNYTSLFENLSNPHFPKDKIAPALLEMIQAQPYKKAYQKAKLFDPDGDAIKKMGNDLTPHQVKKLGRQVKHFISEDWAEKGRVHMFHALTAKFTQNPELKELLLSTGYTLMGEASPFDGIWGIGLGVSKPGVYDPNKWKGHNWLGALMMAVRGSLRQDVDPIGEHCWFEGDTLFYQSEVKRIEDNLYIAPNGMLQPNWKVLIDRFYNGNLDGYKDMADFERHFVCSTLIHTGVLDYAYSQSIDDFEDMEDFK